MVSCVYSTLFIFILATIVLLYEAYTASSIYCRNIWVNYGGTIAMNFANRCAIVGSTVLWKRKSSHEKLEGNGNEDDDTAICLKENVVASNKQQDIESKRMSTCAQARTIREGWCWQKEFPNTFPKDAPCDPTFCSSPSR
mmetsp:Transcript_11045/g.24362  ORF Transcript_11045/g.24362 Transcript_11045/m.24362 type:complete len:140 (+) Transcript_11045:306-725(+)